MLMTEAPLSTALLIAFPDAEQVIVPSPFVFGTVASGTLRARAPGHTPRMPTPFWGAAATAWVAVPWASVTGVPGIVVAHGSPVHSGWVRSDAASISAISGLSGVTGGGISSGETTFARQSLGGPVSGSLGIALSSRSSVLAWAYTSRPRSRRASAKARA